MVRRTAWLIVLSMLALIMARVTATTAVSAVPAARFCSSITLLDRGLRNGTALQSDYNHLDWRQYAQVRATCIYGWNGREWACLDQLWRLESGWRPLAQNPREASYGIPQANPGWKMASAGADWRWNGRTQVRWGMWYIFVHYGRPTRATFRNRPCMPGY